MNLHIDVENFLKTLPVMLFGMIGVFVALMAIYGAIALMIKIFGNNGKKKSDVPEKK